jgi:exo-1,4-beta-D-glucosaminidase
MSLKLVSRLLFLWATILSLSAVAQKPVELSSTIPLKENWQVQQSGKINLTGAQISATGLRTGSWYKGVVPSTIMGVLIRNGLYKDIFVGDNYGAIDKSKFDDSWWYRKEFKLEKLKAEQHVILHFDGISYYANIWLNGKQIASRDSIFGPFRRYAIDISRFLDKNENVLAIEVFRAQPGDFNLGFVDWNPRPADENMGIWREVYLSITGEVSLTNTVVQSKLNTSSLSEADLTIKTSLKNYSLKTESGVLKGRIENREFRYPVTLKPGEKLDVKLTPSEIPLLHINNPRVWWCNNLGKPELYKLQLSYVAGNQISDAKEVTFGIRDIEMYTNVAGHKGFKLNGKEILIKGAGWTDDIFLRDSAENLETQVQYVKHMNLNTIRFENIWGNTQEIYDLCDKYGILMMVGWSCHWEWEEYLGKPCDDYGGIKSDEDIALAVKSFRDQVLWLRNHPGIFVWMVGSDKCPRPELELKYDSLLKQLDTRPYISAASARKSEISGPTGVKMNGPYDYVSPNYWYIDTINGGAFGFNTETGPGPQVLVLESLKKIIPAGKLWPVNELWDYHCTHSKQAFNTMNVFNTALDNRFGKPSDLNDYLMKADVQSYEALKAMYEAFRVRIPNTTGIIQWMLNSAWPSLYWHLYDYYLLPSAAYYAARKANEPLQIIYDYGKNAVFVVNEKPGSQEYLLAKVKILDVNSKVLFDKELELSVESNVSKQLISLDAIHGTVFLDLKLFNKSGQVVADNFYWLNEKQDLPDFAKTTWAYTPMKEYTDFSGLNNLPKTDINLHFFSTTEGNSLIITTEISNKTDKTAFFMSLAILDEEGKRIFPVFWDDNYFSLPPGESRTIKCTVPKLSLKEHKTFLELSGWNIKTERVEIR